MISSLFLVGRDRYERVMEGWVDNTHEDAFTHTVTMTDDDGAIEFRAVCTPSPSYEIRDAEGRVRTGSVDPAILERLERLKGARMVGGFSKLLAEVCGVGPGAGLFVEAGVEAARLTRQVTKLPREATSGFDPRDARRCWDLDMAGWPEFPNSCFTYSKAGRALLDERAVSVSMGPELYAPPPGARRIFVRKKRSRLVLTGRRLHLFHSMHDNVHGFDVHYELDLDAGTVVAADSITSRLPYAGVCTEPQGRIAAMIGQPADLALRKRAQSLLGGEAGCAQLYDLTTDLLKLVTFTG
jgi:hypothetical protein